MEKLEVKVIDPDDNRLRQISSEVSDFKNEEYMKILDQMKAICIERKAYAAAAPQFGILKRFILIMTVEEIKVKDALELENAKLNYVVTPYFNPRITVMRGKQYFYESCMSVEKTTGKVARPYYIELEAQDINGNYFYKTAEGFEAIVLCHEIDHLDGIEYIDKSENIFTNIDVDERLEIRRKYPHEIVSKEGEFNQDNIDERVRTRIYEKRQTS